VTKELDNTLVGVCLSQGYHLERLDAELQEMKAIVETLRLILLTHMRQCNRDLGELAFFLPTEARQVLERASVLDKAPTLADHKDDLSGV